MKAWRRWQYSNLYKKIRRRFSGIANSVESGIPSLVKYHTPFINKMEKLLFDKRFYIENAPIGSKLSSAASLVHYLAWGHYKNLNPHLLFDVEYYKKQRPDVVSSGMNVLVHYFLFGDNEGTNPHPLFDVQYYKQQRPDVAHLGVNTLVHYLKYGDNEGTNPHPLFDVQYYKQQRPDVVHSGVNTLAHYLQHGVKENANPHPLFDTAYYFVKNPKTQKSHVNPLVDYVLNSNTQLQINPHPLFDTHFYVSQEPQLTAFARTPLEHYLRYGAYSIRSPHVVFDNEFYLSRYCDVAASLQNPLVHYILFGKNEKRKPCSRILSFTVLELLKKSDFKHASIVFQLENNPSPVQHLTPIHVGVSVSSVYEEVKKNGDLVLEHAQEKIWIEEPSVLNRLIEHASGWVDAPRAYIGVLRNVRLIGGTRLIINQQGDLLHDELAMDDAQYFGVKAHRYATRYENHILLNCSKKYHKAIESGVLISCDYDANYFHWMIECLPKVLCVDESNLFHGQPLLVSRQVHANCLAALEIVNENKRPILFIEDNFLYDVKQLIYVSDLSRILDRYQGEASISDHIISQKWVQKLIEKLSLKSSLSLNKNQRKVFLSRRRSGYRNLMNQKELEGYFLNKGAEIVDLSEMDFNCQRLLFSQTSFFAGAIGAAITNVILCQPGTHGLVFAPDHPCTNYFLFNQLATIAGVQLKYLAGQRGFIIEEKYGVHDDFKISLDELTKFSDLPRGS